MGFMTNVYENMGQLQFGAIVLKFLIIFLCLQVSLILLYRVNSIFCIYIRISVIDNKILCVHGGLSPSITTLDQIRSIDRKVKISEKILKGCSDPGSFIFEIDVGKRQIRHTTTLILNDKLTQNRRCHSNSESF